jgi:hypothetical protein
MMTKVDLMIIPTMTAGRQFSSGITRCWPIISGSPITQRRPPCFRCGCNAGLSSVAKGLAQMGVGLAILTETKVTDNRHPCLASGYKILALKTASHNQGGIALLWKENCGDYEVESMCIVMPNLLTFQLVTGNE